MRRHLVWLVVWSVSIGPLTGQGLGVVGGLGAGLTAMDPGWAADRGIGASGFVVQVSVEVTALRFFVVAFDGAGHFQSDQRTFANSTTGGTLESGIEMFSGSWLAGVRLPIDIERARIVPSVRYGRMSVAATRGISNCAGCDVQDLAVEGGGFFEGRLTVYRGQVGIGGFYRLFRPDSFFENSFGLRLEVGGGRNTVFRPPPKP